MEEKNFDSVAQEVYQKLDEILPEDTTTPKTEEVKEVKEVEGDAKEKAEPTAQETPKEEVSPEQVIAYINSLGIKARGKEKTLASLDELKRIVNLGFNYELKVAELNEERKKIKQKIEETKEETPFDAGVIDTMEDKLKRVEEKINELYQEKLQQTYTTLESSVNETFDKIKDMFGLSDSDLDILAAEAQSKIDNYPEKDIDIDTFFTALVIQLFPDAITRIAEHQKKQQIDQQKKSERQKVTTEGGKGGAISSKIKPKDWDDALDLALKDLEL